MYFGAGTQRHEQAGPEHRGEATRSDAHTDLFISHLSALRYWRRDEGLGTSELVEGLSLDNATKSVRDCNRLLSAKMDTDAFPMHMSEGNPLYVLVGCKGARRYASTLVPRVWQGPVPANAFRRIGPHIYVSSPEFVFVQMASTLSIVELAQLGNELCGGYYLQRVSGFGEHTDKQPLTSRADLKRFALCVATARGAKKALRALRWVCDRCNSPMETNVLLMLCMPSRMGGWQLPLPAVNKPIEVGKRLARYVGGRLYAPDFMWEVHKAGKRAYVTAEYDSSEHHDDADDAQHTRIRRNDMKVMGYLVTSINASQVADANRFQLPARQIARDLGIYRRPLSPQRLLKQNQLIWQLRQEDFR